MTAGESLETSYPYMDSLMRNTERGLVYGGQISELVSLCTTPHISGFILPINVSFSLKHLFYYEFGHCSGWFHFEVATRQWD